MPGIPGAPAARSGRPPIRGRCPVVAVWLASLQLASCAAAPSPDGATRGVVFPSRYLEAVLSEPAGYDTSRTYPLLVALHGYGDNAAGFARVFESTAWARCFVAVPEAEHALGNGGTSWFLLTRDRSLWPASDGHAVAAVVALVEALRARYRIDRVFVLGFSQGATLAYMVGLLHPTLFSGVLAIGGRLPDVDTAGAIVHAADLERAGGARVFVARGRDDPTFPRRAFLAQAELLASRGFAVTRFEYGGGHDLPAEVMERAARWLREASKP